LSLLTAAALRPQLATPRTPAAAAELRVAFDREVFAPNLARLRARYPVHVRDTTIAGVPVHVVTPAGGVPPANRRRVLIALHSGGFVIGGGPAAIGLAVPVAALARVTVVAVDYRLAPEHPFPAAVADAAAVYRALLARRPAETIGVYGCSAGGLLAGQLLARLQRDGTRPPAAVGVLCVGGFPPDQGAPAAWDTVRGAYGVGASLDDPLFASLNAPEVLRRFPPTLVITSTGSGEYAKALALRDRLEQAGAPVTFKAWPGLSHAFFDPFGDPLTPQAQEAQAAIAAFFDARLAR
jgi:acetyl esterase/lipase